MLPLDSSYISIGRIPPVNIVKGFFTIALAKVDFDTRKVDVISIPRDTYTYIPKVNKKDKINHAYAFGSIKGNGINESVETINKFIKYTTVDYYITLEMEPIPKIERKVSNFPEY